MPLHLLYVLEAQYESSLPGSFHRAAVVVPADERHRLVSRDSVEDSHARQGCPRPPVSTATGNLDAFVRRARQSLFDEAPCLLTVR